MSELRRQDIISDEALNAPKEMAAALDELIKVVDKLIARTKEQGQTIASAGTTTKLSKETEQLTLQEKELIKIQGQITSALAKNNDEYILHKKGLDAVNKATKEKIELGGRDARTINAQNASIKELTFALGKNREAYRLLGSEEKRASEEGQKLLAIIQKQDAEVKELNATTGNFQANVGNYPTTLNKAGDAFQQVTPGIAGMTQSLLAATKAAVAFILTPIGAFLAVLAVALAPIILFFKEFGDGADYVEKKTSGLKEGLTFLKYEFTKLGADVVNSDSKLGDFVKKMLFANPIVLSLVGSVKLLRAAFPGLAEGFDTAVKAGESFAETMDEIDTRRVIQSVRNAQEENEIKRLILQSKDRTKTEDERLALVNKALDMEQALSERAVQNAKEERDAIIEKSSLYTSVRREQFRSDNEYYEALLLSFDKEREELRDLVRDKIVAVEEAAAASIAIEEKLQNEKAKLSDKIAADDAKAIEAAKQRREKLNQAIFELDKFRLEQELKSISNIEERAQKEKEIEAVKVEYLLSQAGLLAQEKIKIDEEYNAKIKEIDKKALEDRRQADIKLTKEQAEKDLKAYQEFIDEKVNLIREEVLTGNKTKKDGDKEINDFLKSQSDELIQKQIDGLNKLLETEKLTAEEEAEIYKQLYKLKNDLEKAYYDQVTDNNENRFKAEIDSLNKIQAIYEAYSQNIGALINSITAARLQNIDLEIKASDARTKRELENAGTNEEAKKKIEADGEKRREALERKKVEAARKAAIFEKAAALISAGIQVALNILKAAGSAPPPFNVPLIAQAATLGALQVASIAAKPIPKYEVGVDSAPGGLAIVGEKGHELMIGPNGEIGLTPPTATLMDIAKGTQIVPHDETMKALALASMGSEALIQRENLMLYGKLESLENTIKEYDSKIVAAIIENSTDFYEQGSILLRIKKKADGSKKYIRSKSLND